MLTMYIGVAMAIALICVVGSGVSVVEYFDSYHADMRQHWAKISLAWFAGIPASILWPILLPVALVGGVMFMFREAFPERFETND